MAWGWVKFGVLVSGPSLFKYVNTLDEAEIEIEKSMKLTEFDRDDYTCTQLYARAYRGALTDMQPDDFKL
jgi:hypothetical protein